jgi:hypothetical protein
MKRVVLVLICLALLSSCVSDDVSTRRYGQQLVCHKDRSMAVTSGDLIVHQDHGDMVGPCPNEK